MGGAEFVNCFACLKRRYPPSSLFPVCAEAAHGLGSDMCGYRNLRGGEPTCPNRIVRGGAGSPKSQTRCRALLVDHDASSPGAETRATHDGTSWHMAANGTERRREGKIMLLRRRSGEDAAKARLEEEVRELRRQIAWHRRVWLGGAILVGGGITMLSTLGWSVGANQRYAAAGLATFTAINSILNIAVTWRTACRRDNNDF